MAHDTDPVFSRLNFDATCWCTRCGVQHRMNVVQGITLSTCLKGNVGSFHFRVGLFILGTVSRAHSLLQCEFSGVSQWIHPQDRGGFYWQAVQQLVAQRVRIWRLPGRRFSVSTTTPLPPSTRAMVPAPPSRSTAAAPPSRSTAAAPPSRSTAAAPPSRSTAAAPPSRSTAAAPSNRLAAPAPSTRITAAASFASRLPNTSRPSRSATRIVRRGVKRERSPSSEEIDGEIRRRRRRSPSIEIVGEYRRVRSPSVEIIGELRRFRSPSVEILN
jgi:hypothetical protein